MDNIKIKRTKLLTPLIFDINPDKFVVTLTRPSHYTSRVAGNNRFNFELEETTNRFWRKSLLRSINYYVFRGGLMWNTEIIALLAKDSHNQLWCVMQSEFVNEHAKETKIIKKRLKELGIDVKKQIILGTEEEIRNKFTTVLNPTMDDYREEVKLEKARKFIENERRKAEISIN